MIKVGLCLFLLSLTCFVKAGFRGCDIECPADKKCVKKPVCEEKECIQYKCKVICTKKVCTVKPSFVTKCYRGYRGLLGSKKKCQVKKIYKKECKPLCKKICSKSFGCEKYSEPECPEKYVCMEPTPWHE